MVNPTRERITIGAIAITVVFVLASIIRMATYREERTMTLTYMQWHHSVDIESFTLVAESDWHVPDGGRVDHTAREFYTTETYIAYYKTKSYRDSYTCGKKTCYRNKTRQVAVYATRDIYRTKYYYYIDRWIKTRAVIKEGTDHNPVWPNINDLRTHSPIEYGDERAGMRLSHYMVIFTDDKQYTADITLDAYQSYTLNNKYIVVLNYFGEIKGIKPANT